MPIARIDTLNKPNTLASVRINPHNLASATPSPATLAPIILFTYNRPKHTAQVLESLKANPLAKHSEIFIFADAQKTGATKEQIDKVAKTRTLLKNLQSQNLKNHHFKRVEIILQSHNLGLCDSIISGVSRIMREYGRAIVLEDDIVVSPRFLDFMNAGLEKYANEPKVWSINAWNYPIDSSDLEDSFFWRVPHCWGWGSWGDRWNLFKRDISWVMENFNKNDISHINLENYARFYDDFLLNAKGKIKSWAIFNYLICYKHRGLNLTPKIPYIRQIGFDGSGVHCGALNEDIYNAKTLNTTFPITFPRYIEESRIALTRIQKFHSNLKKPLITRAKNKAMKIAKMFSGGGERYTQELTKRAYYRHYRHYKYYRHCQNQQILSYAPALLCTLAQYHTPARPTSITPLYITSITPQPNLNKYSNPTPIISRVA